MRVFLVVLVFIQLSRAWYIAPPRVDKEWKQLASLVVNTFDAPNQDAPLREKLSWNLLENRRNEHWTYRNYVRTARKMKGNKYAILLAKEDGRVIGAAELGIHLDQNKTKRATIGVLCVDRQFRHNGIATALVQRCEHLVANVWHDDCVYAQVEPKNVQALGLFQSCGFVIGDQRQRVMIRRKGKFESRSHLLLSKQLNKTSYM